ncbi:unnamed protein product [Pleuronectes platessa]|uniref:Uncharacterized protein n=1 Tax=Pleuronectes platessa TaxID=8262 RepID=A0A9N7YB60_PLEPL|nr:unnamed protein product [Pleuronectes platessa]
MHHAAVITFTCHRCAPRTRTCRRAIPAHFMAERRPICVARPAAAHRGRMDGGPVPSWINALKSAALNTKACTSSPAAPNTFSRGHSLCHAPVFPPRAAIEPPWGWLIASPAVLSWHSTPPAEARSLEGGSSLPSTIGLSLVSSCAPEKALGSAYTEVEVEAGPGMKAALSSDYLEEAIVQNLEY